MESLIERALSNPSAAANAAIVIFILAISLKAILEGSSALITALKNRNNPVPSSSSPPEMQITPRTRRYGRGRIVFDTVMFVLGMCGLLAAVLLPPTPLTTSDAAAIALLTIWLISFHLRYR